MLCVILYFPYFPVNVILCAAVYIRGGHVFQTGPSEPGGAGGASALPIFCNYLLFKFSRKYCKAIP